MTEQESKDWKAEYRVKLDAERAEQEAKLEAEKAARRAEKLARRVAQAEAIAAPRLSTWSTRPA